MEHWLADLRKEEENDRIATIYTHIPAPLNLATHLRGPEGVALHFGPHYLAPLNYRARVVIQVQPLDGSRQPMAVD